MPWDRISRRNYQCLAMMGYVVKSAGVKGSP
jgi:hypothetical protein